MKTRSHRFLLFNFALAALIGIAAGMPVELKADDTEIYLGDASLGQGVRPNVLFILDTSGSMSSKDGGSIDRLDRMKDALDEILTDVNNINVGLMRFTDPGGPILFPVSYIDEDVDVVESGGATSGMNVNVKVAASEDDAEQSKADGAVNVSSVALEIMESPAFVTASPIFAQVSSQANNAEQRTGDGDVITANQIDMVSNQTNAVRFENITIPPNSEILDVRIQFTARNGDSSNTDLTIWGDADVNASTFSTGCGSCYDVTNRTRTAASVPWSPNAWSSNEAGPDTTTPNLKDIVQEIVGQPAGPATGWASGNPLVFIQTHGGSGRRRAYTYQGSASKAAKLTISYAVSSTPTLQWIGLRFRDVGIPQGAKINSAYIEFTAVDGNTDPPVSAKIYGDKTLYGSPERLDAAPFQEVKDDITDRDTTGDVKWSNIEQWEDPVPPVDPLLPPVPKVYQTPDIAKIVQEIVDEDEWCGNNAMGFIFEEDGGPGLRIASSFDGDPNYAPVLRIDWDETTGTSGCINQWTQRQVDSGSDDAEETISSGSVSTGGSQFDMRSSQINGLRFDNLQIPQGATIHEAYLTFTARSTDTGASTLRFWNQQHDDAPAFSSNNSDVSNRTKGASVDWTPNDWDTVDEQHTTPDIKALIQDVVSRSGWKGGGAIVILQELVSGSQRRAYTNNGSPAKAPVLTVKFEGSLTSGGSGTKTVRTKLKELIQGFDHSGHTPVVDTLYEAALYYRGDTPLYGAMRGHDRDGTYSPNPNASSTNDGVRRNTRLSHPSSYTGGTPTYPGNCTDSDLNHSDCKDQVISGTPVYTSPITESCQANYIILLTDGYANHNHSEDLAKSMTGVGTCTEGDGRNDSCGRDITKWLANNDQGKGPSGDQYVTTYTIGFNFSSDWLKNVAIDGGGSFYTADSSNELVNVFKAIIADILSRTTSFATPALSVNAFNKLFHRNDVYFSLFKPSGKARWDGNVKKYELCESAADGCDLGEVLDATGGSAVNASNAIRDEALSFWSDGTDGAEIKVGGAGNEIPAHATRRVYTYTGGGLPAKLSDPEHLVKDDNTDDVTKTLLGDPTMSDSDQEDLINWIRGQDIDDEDGDGNSSENRFAFHDPLHSSPVAVTYGGTEADPVIKLFVGTNDGGIRMVNAWHDPTDSGAVRGGEEEWIFYPQETIGQQIKLRPNPNADHFYGIDGTPTLWLNDEPNPDGVSNCGNFKNVGDGVIHPDCDANGDGVKEFVRLFIGMRRGGNHYYGLDVTPSSATGPLTDPTQTDKVPPTLMWTITGGAGDFPRLGQSWSQPKLAKIAIGTTTADEVVSKTVLVFAGGYDTTQDSGFTTGGGELGNAIYVVDPTDGSRLFWISGTDHGAAQGVEVPGMDWPIPSDVAFYDSNGDGLEDRLYIGDTGGNIWRVDLRADLTTSAGIKATVGKFAEVSDDATPADQRKFFYKPDVVQVHDAAFSDVGRYDLVTINTGNRAHPLDVSVQDRFYAMRDYHVHNLVDGDPDDTSDDDGLADGYTTLNGKVASPGGDFLDVTNINDPQGTDLTDLKAAAGYFIDFEGNGEKGLASPVVLGGTAFFTSYLPEGVVSSTTCSLAEGSGLLYAINVLNGSAVYPNWDGVGDDTNLTKADRTYTLGGGIPSSAVPIFQEEGITLLIGGGGGATTIDPNLTLPRDKTYWGQEE